MQRSNVWNIARRAGRLACKAPAVALGLVCTVLFAPAHAADPNVAITVTPIPATVSLRVPGSTTQAAYRVDIVNGSTNVLNEVRFTASTRVSPAASPAGTRYVEDSSAQCGPAPGSQTVLSCNFGQLRGASQPGANSSSFVVVFEAPATGERLFLDWTANYKEGTNDNNGNPPNNDTQSSADPGKAVFTSLVSSAAVSDKQLRSYFAASTGAVLFTSTGVPTSADAWTTALRIPTGTAGEARIVEDSDANSCSAVIPACVRSAVTVPGSFVDATPLDADLRFLIITLRRDASTIPTGAQIAKAPLLYEPGSIDANGVFQPAYPGNPAFPIGLKLCSEIGGAPSLPAAGTPLAEGEQQKRCIKSFQAYPKNAKAPPGLQGDWEWVIWAIENGRISF